MSGRYRTHINPLAAADSSAVPLAGLDLDESFGTGWIGKAHLYLYATQGKRIGIEQMLRNVIDAGLSTAEPALISLASDDAASVRRSWPSVITAITPYQPQDSITDAACELAVADPITYLSERPIWGAYRTCSLGRIVGGALSLAAGGDGKPTLTPILTGLPTVRIVEDFRQALNQLAYAIATGQTLREWLNDLFGMLGVRFQLAGQKDGTVEVTLSDRLPRGAPFSMQVSSDLQGGRDAAPNAPDKAPPLRIVGIEGLPGETARGGVLDDPTHGTFRYIGAEGTIGAEGAVGTVVTGTGVDIDEAVKRMGNSVAGAHAEMLQVVAASRYPVLRPGKLVQLDRSVLGHTLWQPMQVRHHVRNGIYDNDVVLIRGEVSWHLATPPRRPAVLITGSIDGGVQYAANEPVPRDRQGRVPVAFPFVPVPSDETDQPEDPSSVDQVDVDTAESANDQWPPRIMLTVIEPMAGSMHGFVGGHRQGDVCRVAVYGPLWAEVLGFQYRSNRQINADIQDATAGIVVEHNFQTTWSGMVFRRVEELEDEDEDTVLGADLRDHGDATHGESA